MYKTINKCVVFALLIWINSLQAQDANVQIALQDKGISHYQSIFISDFDFLSVGAVEQLFDMIITKNEGTVTNAVMTITLLQDSKLLAKIVTKPFDMPFSASPPGGWIISNQELARQDYNFNGEGTTIRIAESGLDPDADDLKDEVMASNQIPAGFYILRIEIRYTGDSGPAGSVGINEINIIISNPTLINLITPGVLLNSGFGYEIYTQNPIFQFNGNSGTYRVLVFKKRNEFSSTEDILNSIPVWDSGVISVLSVQYPDGGAVPLEFGSTYAWLAQTIIQTSSGENIRNSELFEFTLVDPSTTNMTPGQMAKQELEALLRQLLGARAESILKQIDNYGLSAIRLNGATISLQDFYQILEKYRDQQHEIYDLNIQSSN